MRRRQGISEVGEQPKALTTVTVKDRFNKRSCCLLFLKQGFRKGREREETGEEG